MATKRKNIDTNKLKGQFYTPIEVVQQILDKSGYIAGQSILDPACGDGRFLIEIVKKIMADIPKTEWEEAFSNVYGWDIDPYQIELCKCNLNRLFQFDWNLTVCDALKHNPCQLFDVIVGNPPYVRIQNMDEATRMFLKERYVVCQKGNIDLYFPFYERSLQLLTPKGVLVFITPNSFTKTISGAILRNMLKPHLRSILDFGSTPIFKECSTYTAIVVCGKEISQEAVEYTHNGVTQNIPKNELWETPNTGGKLGDLVDIRVGIATLHDDVFIFDKLGESGNITYVKNNFGIFHIESGLLKPILKVSKHKKGNPITQVAIYPYTILDNKYICIPESELSRQFPLGYQYLLERKSQLDKRDNGKPNKQGWYAFGRAQGLQLTSNKIVFSTINKTPNFIWVSENTLVYAGYQIIHHNPNQLKKLLKKLNSPEMEQYVLQHGKDMQGGYKSYTKSLVSNFSL